MRRSRSPPSRRCSRTRRRRGPARRTTRRRSDSGEATMRQAMVRRIVRAAVLAGAVVMAPAATYAQSTKPIRLVIGFAAGGPTDVMARIVGAKMGELLGQQVVIEK